MAGAAGVYIGRHADEIAEWFIDWQEDRSARMARDADEWYERYEEHNDGEYI